MHNQLNLHISSTYDFTTPYINDIKQLISNLLSFTRTRPRRLGLHGMLDTTALETSVKLITNLWWWQIRQCCYVPLN